MNYNRRLGAFLLFINAFTISFSAAYHNCPAAFIGLIGWLCGAVLVIGNSHGR